MATANPDGSERAVWSDRRPMDGDRVGGIDVAEVPAVFDEPTERDRATERGK
jgi:hypothetical protein